MTKHYLPDPVMAFDISENIINRGGRLNGKTSRLRECFPKVITIFFILFVFGGGTFLGLTVTTMPNDQAGYVVNENEDMFIYYPGSMYFLSPSVILKMVDLNDRNFTINDEQCTVSINNVKWFIRALHYKHNDDVDKLYKIVVNRNNTISDYGVLIECNTHVDDDNVSPHMTTLSSTTTDVLTLYDNVSNQSVAQ